VTIISFSGIDGAGKSTQIDGFDVWLRESGVRTHLLTFWDNVVVFSHLREYLSLKAFKGDKGVGSPDQPLIRRDKNVTSTPVTLTRFFFYLADAINLRRTVHRLRKSDIVDVVIFDRYIYDELANLPLRAWVVRAFIRLVLSFVPKPNIAFVIDADPDASFARKPEYPLEFLRSNRNAYIELGRISGASTVIEPDTVEAMQENVRKVFLQRTSPSDAAFTDVPALP
jgi:thymidylate kinase